MNDNIRDCLYSFIEEIDNSTIIKELEKNKEIINNNNEIQNLIKNFNIKKNTNDINLQQSKIELYGNEYVSNYLKYEQKLNYIIMDINKDLNRLIDKKGCSR